MSLVNDMLRDLDQRREKPAAGREIPVSASARTEPVRNTRWLGLGAATLVTAGMVGWLLLNPQSDTRPSATSAVPPPAPAATKLEPAAAAMPPPPPVVGLPSLPTPRAVSALSWQRQGEDWLLRLSVNGDAVYTLRKIDSRELQLSLPQTQLAAPLPALPDSLVQSLSLESRNGALELHLASRQAANFQVDPLHNDGGHQLQIRIAARPITNTALVATAPAQAAEPSVLTQAELQPVQKAKPAAAAEAPTRAEAKPAPTAAALAVAPLQKNVRVSAEQRDQQRSSEALALVRKGRTAAAIEGLREFLGEQPGGLQSRTLLATLLLADQQLAEAGQWVEGGLALAPQDTGLRKLKARLLMVAGDNPGAAALLQDGAPALARDREYHQLKAAAEQAAGQHQAASRSYHELLQQDATNPAWWIGLGISLEALQQKAQARQAYSNVLQIPRVPANLSSYARSRLQQLGG